MSKRLLVPLAAFVGAPFVLAQQESRTPIEQALVQWREAHGSVWRMDVDEGTGYVEFLYGGKVAPSFEPVADADWFTLAREALTRTQALHGLEQVTLAEYAVTFLPLGMIGSSDKMTVEFHQEVDGVPVEMGSANVLFDSHGNLLSVQTHALPGIAGLDLTPAFGVREASELAAAWFARDVRLEPTSVSTPELLIAQVPETEQRAGRLCWKVDVQWRRDGSEPEGTLYYLDAETGEVAMRERSIHYFDVGGTVSTMSTPGTAPDSGTNPETQSPMKYARVTSSAGTVFTDANGNFNYPGVTGPLACTFTYVGQFNSVVNQAGTSLSLVQNLTGTGNNVVLNSAPADLVTAQGNAFQAVNVSRDYVRMVAPSDNHADFVHNANVNLAQTCNAYFDGASINFFQAGGGCVNTAYSTVVAHEDGHWLNVKYGTGNGGDGMGEGNADVWAMYQYDTNIVGLNFCGNGCHVRNGLNNTLFCGDCCSACYGEVHADGEPWMAAAWKVRRNLNNTLGNVAGDAVANGLFVGWMNAYNQTQIKSVIETQWLALDDNDGNVNNGTPHFNEINSAFLEQGFPGVTLIPLQITNVTQLPNTQNQNGPYVVNADVVSNVGSTVTGASIFYRVGPTGPFSSVAMTNTSGSTWSGGIPGQTAPKKVYYYVQATDNLANSSVMPAGAPAASYVFSVGAIVQVFCDDFTNDQGWSVADTSITTGTWERGDPVGTTNNGQQSQPETDNPAGSGTFCFFTDQGVAGGGVGDNDVDGGPTVLTSPPFDVSVGNASISYSYWYYIATTMDDAFTVQLSNNGSNWVTARTITAATGGWVTDTIEVADFVAPNATVRIRFSARDNPNNSIVEAALDDLCVTTLGPLGCTGSPTVFCTAKINSQFCTPAIAFNGIPSASSPNAFSISVSQLLNQKTGLLFYGYGTNNTPFKGGIMCVALPVIRTPTMVTGGSTVGNDCTGVLSYDFNARIQSGVDPNLVAGQFCAAEFYYRDPQDPFTIGLSNAVSFTICP